MHKSYTGRLYATVWVSIEPEIKYEGFGGGPSVGGGPGPPGPPLNPALGFPIFSSHQLHNTTKVVEWC